MMDFSIQYFDSLDSTNQEALRQAKKGAKEGLTIVANSQTHGKGRLGRAWQTVPDALALSMVLRPDIDAMDAPQFSLLAAVATHQALALFTPKVGIKWPNDLLIEGKKVCGILTEMQSSAHGIAVILGIGINIHTPQVGWEGDMRTPPASLNDYCSPPVQRDDVLHALLESIHEYYTLWQTQGFSPICQAWEKAHVANQKEVSVFDGKAYIQGLALGLADDGSLRLLVNGKEERIIAGDVSLMESGT